MKILLDTHAFIWWDSDPSMLSPRALAVCQDSSNSLSKAQQLSAMTPNSQCTKRSCFGELLGIVSPPRGRRKLALTITIEGEKVVGYELIADSSRLQQLDQPSLTSDSSSQNEDRRCLIRCTNGGTIDTAFSTDLW
jgi:hypothetical protein